MLFITIGMIAGMLSGLIGIGGGVIVVPALVLFAGFSQLTAQGTSLALFIIPLSIFAFLEYYRAGHVDITVAAFLAVGFLVGSIAGSHFALSINQEILTKIFAIVLILIACKLLFFK